MYENQFDKRLYWQQIENAPNVKGLYCWYYDLSIQKADLNSIEDFVTQLNKNIDIYQIPNLKMKAKGHLANKFSGELKQINPLEENTSFSDEISKIFKSQENREIIQKIFKSLSPMFNVPLYIGIAIDQTLRSRLNEHKNGIISKNIKESSFAYRIINSNTFLDFNKLFVYCYPMKNLTKDMITFLEYFLNRILNPLYGRN